LISSPLGDNNTASTDNYRLASCAFVRLAFTVTAILIFNFSRLHTLYLSLRLDFNPWQQLRHVLANCCPCNERINYHIRMTLIILERANARRSECEAAFAIRFTNVDGQTPTLDNLFPCFYFSLFLSLGLSSWSMRANANRCYSPTLP
jgi:hypothetical protein